MRFTRMDGEVNTANVEMAYISLNFFHQSLGEGDISRALHVCTEGISYRSNFDWPCDELVACQGRTAAAGLLTTLLAHFQYLAVVNQFAFSGDGARASVAYRLTHRSTGLEMVGTCRELIQYEGDRISGIEVYADGPGLEAYMNLVSSHTCQIRQTRRKSRGFPVPAQTG